MVPGKFGQLQLATFLGVTNPLRSSQAGCHKSLVFIVYWQLFNTQAEPSSKPIKVCPLCITWSLAPKYMGCLSGGQAKV